MVALDEYPGQYRLSWVKGRIQGLCEVSVEGEHGLRAGGEAARNQPLCLCLQELLLIEVARKSASETPQGNVHVLPTGKWTRIGQNRRTNPLVNKKEPATKPESGRGRK